MVTLISLAAILEVVRRAEREGANKLFAFYLPWDDSSKTVISLAREKPAIGRVYVGEDGHLYVNGSRIRFLGVNIVGSAAFPSKEDAEKIAGRLAKFGVNIVRFHHMDASWASPNIFNESAGGTRQLDRAALERLDYFISKLKENGIYVNLNLLVSRRFTSADGLPREIDSVDWKDQQVLGFFDDEVLELEKEYARQLLTHWNPYLGSTYAEDPVVAMVEIVNEQGLLHAWLGGVVDRLPDVFLARLREKWNAFLAEKYGSTESLLDSWRPPEDIYGEEMLSNGDFRNGVQGWSIEVHDGARAGYSLRTGPEGLPALAISVSRRGAENWHVQFNYPGIEVRDGESYIVSFKAKADENAVLYVSLRQAHEPWGSLSQVVEIALTPEWRDYTVILLASGTDSNARLDVTNLGARETTYYFANFSMRRFGGFALRDGENLESGTVNVFSLQEYGGRSPQARKDWMEFLWGLEQEYFRSMYKYLKEELGVKSLIIGTIVGCSTPNIMASLDIVDAHAYWQHPAFPHVAWDPSDWYVYNVPMVNYPLSSNIVWLASKRVYGKPFTVTEYNHPAPNTYDLETVAILATYAALQDWDGIFLFDYGSLNNWDSRKIRGFFDVDQHPAKMATLIPAYTMFVRGDVPPAEELILYGMDRETELRLLVEGKAAAWNLPSATHIGMDPRAPLIHRVGLALDGRSSGEPQFPEKVYVSDNSVVRWDCGAANRCFLEVDSSGTIALLGYIGERNFSISGVEVQVGKTLLNGFAGVFLVVLDGKDFRDWSRILVIAVGYTGNTNMRIRDYDTGNTIFTVSESLDRVPEYSGRITCGSDWGRAPTLTEGVTARILLHGVKDARVWALDNKGEKAVAVAVEAGGDSVSFTIGPQYNTIWYLVERG